MAESDFKRWLDAAWTDWVQPLGILILGAAFYGAYHFDILGERAAGFVLVLAVLVGALLTGLLPAFGLVRRSSERSVLWVVAALAVAGSAWPSLRAAWSPAPLAEAQLRAGALTATLDTHSNGPYELVVSGRFKESAGEAEASYIVRVEGNGKDEVAGDIKRATHHFRTGRRGGMTTSVEERTESVHRLDHVAGSNLTVSVDGVDDQLAEGLVVGVRSAGPRREIFWVLGGLAVLFALWLDGKLATEIREEERKVRGPKREVTFLGAVTGILLVFTINFPMDATPRTLVRTAVGALILACIIGGGGGWLLGSFARLAMRPKRKR